MNKDEPQFSYNFVRSVLLEEYRRATRSQAANEPGTPAFERATAAIISVTDVAGKMGIVL